MGALLGISRNVIRRRAWHRARREHFRALGQTHDGKPRKHGTWHRYADLDHLPPRARAAARVQRWRERERYRKGLSQRGLPQGNIGGRKPKVNPVAEAWKEFRATISNQK